MSKKLTPTAPNVQQRYAERRGGNCLQPAIMQLLAVSFARLRIQPYASN